MYNSNVTVLESTFKSNEAYMYGYHYYQFYGGCCYNYVGTAYAYGGAVYLESSEMTVESSIFDDNNAYARAYYCYPRGAGFYVVGDSSLSILTSTISDNSVNIGSCSGGNCYAYGGAIYVDDGKVRLWGSTMSSNYAYSDAADVYVDSTDSNSFKVFSACEAGSYEIGSGSIDCTGCDEYDDDETSYYSTFTQACVDCDDEYWSYYGTYNEDKVRKC